MKPAGYNDFIFINCPFDADYITLLRAIVFTIYRCGFVPITALNRDNALENRLSKIENCIEGCRYGVHDLSRTQLTSNNLPRFNMPFELGMFFGAKRFGDKHQKNKNAIIFDIESHRYLEFISDINGVDIKAHNNDPFVIMRKIRDWLHTASRRKTIPGYTILTEDYNGFLNNLPAITSKFAVNMDDIPFNDYCVIVEEFLKRAL